MAIRFETITPAPKSAASTANDVRAEGLVSCTRSELAPLDCRIANEPSRKIADVSRKIDTNICDTVAVRKRGRPAKADALSAAERQRRCRERKRAAAS